MADKAVPEFGKITIFSDTAEKEKYKLKHQ